MIAVEADRLERLVGDVLDLAKLDAHRFTVLREEVDMGSLIDQVYAAFGEEAKRRGIDYSCDAHAKPVIVTDGDRVFQIVSNLVSNAFRWTPDGGRVSLALAADERSHLGLGAGHRAGDPADRAGADLPAVLVRGTAAGPVSGSRSPASWRSRSAAGSSSTASRRHGSRFDLLLPARRRP